MPISCELPDTERHGRFVPARCSERYPMQTGGPTVTQLRGQLSMTQRSGKRVRRRQSRGQSLAEFALVFPVLMLIIGGIIQFGLIFWGQNTLTQVVRDTGRWAATQTDCIPASAVGPVIATANAIAAQSSLIGYTPGEFNGTNTTVTWRSEPVGDPCPPVDNQDEAWVRITINHSVPIFFPFVPGNGQLASTTEFRMEPAP
jgi:Flp pilus assembly protein TadG